MLPYIFNDDGKSSICLNDNDIILGYTIMSFFHCSQDIRSHVVYGKHKVPGIISNIMV